MEDVALQKYLCGEPRPPDPIPFPAPAVAAVQAWMSPWQRQALRRTSVHRCKSLIQAEGKNFLLDESLSNRLSSNITIKQSLLLD